MATGRTPRRTARIRHNIAVPVAGLIAAIGSVAVAGQSWILAPIILIPLAVMWWGLRSGVDVRSSGLSVRGMFGHRDIDWPRVTGFRVDRRRVFVELDAGTEMALPAVSPDQVPSIIELSGEQYTPAER